MSKVVAACLLALALLPAGWQEPRVLYSVDVSTAGRRALEALKSADGVVWHVELGDVLVVEGTRASLESAASLLPTQRLPLPERGRLLYVAQRLHANDLEGV